MIKMVEGGKIAPGDLMKCAMFPSHEHSLEDIRAILDSSDIAALWEVEVFEPKLIVHPAWEVYRQEAAAAGGDEVKKAAAYKAYARKSCENLLAASGWFWVDIMKAGQDDFDGEAFLKELCDEATEQTVDKFQEMRVEIWYAYLRLKRKDI
jgi:hypothetical protein